MSELSFLSLYSKLTVPFQLSALSLPCTITCFHRTLCFRFLLLSDFCLLFLSFAFVLLFMFHLFAVCAALSLVGSLCLLLEIHLLEGTRRRRKKCIFRLYYRKPVHTARDAEFIHSTRPSCASFIKNWEKQNTGPGRPFSKTGMDQPGPASAVLGSLILRLIFQPKTVLSGKQIGPSWTVRRRNGVLTGDTYLSPNFISIELV